MDTLTYRLAQADDVPALHALVESAYRGNSAKRGWTHEADLLDGDRTTPETLAATIADPASRVILAEDERGLVGTVTTTSLGGGRAYLGMLGVDPARQAGGLGRELIARAEATARDEFGAGIMEMTVIDQRPELVAYYVRRGYAVSGETRPFPLPGDFPFVMVVLEKRIG